MSLSLSSITSVLILASEDGSRILAKYYENPQKLPGSASTNPYASVKEQKSFEKGLVEKTNKVNGDIILYDNRVVVYKQESDILLYVVGGSDENEILLFNVLLALRDSLTMLLRSSVDKRTAIENYDILSLAVDELVDDGIILETDPVIITQRVSKPPAQDVSMKGIDLSEQGLLNAWEYGKRTMGERIRQGF